MTAGVGRLRAWMIVSWACGALLVLPRADAAAAARSTRADADVLSQTLQGEFALQGGEGKAAATRYLDAAMRSPDPGLAERATDIAMIAHEDVLAGQALARWRELAPRSVNLDSAEALLALRRGDRSTADRDLMAMLDADREGWKRAIRVLASATDAAASVQVAGDLYQHGHLPQDAAAWIAFGELSRRLGDADLMQRVVGDTLRRFPDDPRAWLLEAGRLQERHDDAGARRALERALSQGSADENVRYAVASAYAKMGDPKAAAATLAKSAQDNPSYVARAAYLAQAKDDPGLAALYAEVKSQEAAPDGERRLLLGQLAEYLKRPDEALEWYRQVEQGKAYNEAQDRIAVILEARGDLEGALTLLRLQQHEEVSSDTTQSDSFRLEAELLAKHGRKDEALRVYDRGLAFFDGDADLLYGRALLLEDLDRVADAEADLRVIVAADPGNADALNALGYTLADRTNRYAEAQALIEKALQIQPDSPAFLDSLGWVQHRLGRDAEALRNLRRAFTLLKDPEIAAHLGEVLWLGGDKDAARAIWKEGVALDKDNRAMQRVMQTYKP